VRALIHDREQDHVAATGDQRRRSKRSPTGECWCIRERLCIEPSYLELGELHVEVLGRGTAWLDIGTASSLLQASLFIETLERRQGLQIACPGEVAYRMGYIERDALARLATNLKHTGYGDYPLQLAAE